MNGSTTMTRRRFLRIVGTSIAYTAISPTLGFSDSPIYKWDGEVLGGLASMTFVADDHRQAEKLTALCLKEVSRLENIFSLYLPGSSIRELNKNGFLNTPPAELVELLRESNKLSELSSGAFDISLQPLWKYLYYLDNTKPDPKIISKLSALINYKNINISDQKISFAEKGMQITLNGIAQGYITDKVTNLLRNNGMKNVLVELGETYALGRNDQNELWKIGIKHPKENKLLTTIELENQALATSGGYGTPFENNKTQLHHLINPKTATSSDMYQSVSVIAPNATTADGLSTTLSLLPKEKHLEIIKNYPGSYALIFPENGKSYRIG